MSSLSNFKLPIWTLLHIILLTLLALTTSKLLSPTLSNCLVCLTVLLIHTLFASGAAVKKYRWVGIALCALFLQSIFFAQIVHLSLTAITYWLAFFIYFCTLCDQKSNYDQYYKISLYLVTFLGFINALSMMVDYTYMFELSLKPGSTPRSTGLFVQDFSQAALICLLSIALMYAKSRNTVFGLAFAFIMFIGLFTSYSRTVNALVIIFLSGVFILESTRNNCGFALKMIALSILAFLIIHYFPLLIDQTAIQRNTSEQLILGFSGRVVMWKVAITEILQRPLLGHGLGGFRWSKEMQLAVPMVRYPVVHNDYLEFARGFGIPWTVISIIALIKVALTTNPFINSITTLKSFKLNTSLHTEQTTAWLALICIYAYMMINFILYNPLILMMASLFFCNLLRSKGKK